MSLVVPTGLRAVTLGDDRRDQVGTWDRGSVRTAECEGRASGGGKDPALASDSEGAARIALRPRDVQEQGWWHRESGQTGRPQLLTRPAGVGVCGCALEQAREVQPPVRVFFL